MDQIKTGQFIASLRKEKEMTQQQLADILNISNKTISKWETGNGFPEVSLLLTLCNALGISVNELLSAEKLSDSDYKQKAEENLLKTIESSSFTLNDRIKYFKKKWLKEHIWLILLSVFAWLGLIFFTAYLGAKEAVGLIGGFSSVTFHIMIRNQMMIYVEKRAFKPE